MGGGRETDRSNFVQTTINKAYYRYLSSLLTKFSLPLDFIVETRFVR